MKVGYWRIQFVQRKPRSEKEFALGRVLTVAYLRTIRKQDPEAYVELVQIVVDSGERGEDE